MIDKPQSNDDLRRRVVPLSPVVSMIAPAIMGVLTVGACPIGAA
jgi:hypothetical protein